MAKKRGERADKAANHKVIKEAFLKLLKDKAKAPTIKELAEVTGLSYQAVKAHIKTLKFDTEDSPYRVLSAEVFEAIYKRAIGYEEDDLHFSSYKGDVTATPYKKKIIPEVSAQKLWVQLVEGWSEKTSTDITSGGEPVQQVIKIGYGKTGDQD